MISTPTVFILGAGASHAYNFPLGERLVDTIKRLSTNDFLPHGLPPDYVARFQTELNHSRQKSIDAFLEHRKEFLQVGKLAIALTLIRCEDDAACFPTSEHDWYGHIIDKMTASTPFDKVAANKVSFITSNYDRSLEHVLSTALQYRYGKTAEEVAVVLRCFPFIHIHGQLGYLPWQKSKPEDQRQYVPHYDKHIVETAVRGIRIISEELDPDGPDFVKARERMADAHRIAILGFGYHPLNMRRLNIPFKPDKVSGTAMGLTPAERKRLTDTYNHLYLGHDSIMEVLRNHPHYQRD